MSKNVDLTGQRFGKLRVLEQAEDLVTKKGRHFYKWKCLCDCGEEYITYESNLLSGKVHQCKKWSMVKLKILGELLYEYFNNYRGFIFFFGIIMLFSSFPTGTDIESIVFAGVVLVIGFVLCVKGFNICNEQSYYLEAEPITYGDTFTVFNTQQGNYIVNNCYSERTFLLTMSTNNTKTTDDDEIIVIWKLKDMEGEIK